MNKNRLTNGMIRKEKGMGIDFGIPCHHWKCSNDNCENERMLNSKVISTRPTFGKLFLLRRRRECMKCGERFTTYEIPSNTLDYITNQKIP